MIQILRYKERREKLTIQNLIEAIERFLILLYDQTEVLYQWLTLKFEVEDILHWQCHGPRWVDVIGKQDSEACLEQLLDGLHKELWTWATVSHAPGEA